MEVDGSFHGLIWKYWKLPAKFIYVVEASMKAFIAFMEVVDTWKLPRK